MAQVIHTGGTPPRLGPDLSNFPAGVEALVQAINPRPGFLQTVSQGLQAAQQPTRIGRGAPGAARIGPRQTATRELFAEKMGEFFGEFGAEKIPQTELNAANLLMQGLPTRPEETVPDVVIGEKEKLQLGFDAGDVVVRRGGQIKKLDDAPTPLELEKLQDQRARLERGPMTPEKLQELAEVNAAIGLKISREGEFTPVASVDVDGNPVQVVFNKNTGKFTSDAIAGAPKAASAATLRFQTAMRAAGIPAGTRPEDFTEGQAQEVARILGIAGGSGAGVQTKEFIAFREARSTAIVMAQSVERLRGLIKSPRSLTGTLGAATNLLSSLVGQAQQLGKLFDAQVDEVGVLDHTNPAFQDAFKDLRLEDIGARGAAMRTNFLNLAYIQARLQDPRDRVSNEAVRLSLKALGRNTGNKAAQLASLDEALIGSLGQVMAQGKVLKLEDEIEPEILDALATAKERADARFSTGPLAEPRAPTPTLTVEQVLDPGVSFEEIVSMVDQINAADFERLPFPDDVIRAIAQRFSSGR